MERTQTRLNPDDQARVDAFLTQGINATERSRFRPFRLMLWLAVIIVLLGVLSRAIGVLILA